MGVSRGFVLLAGSLLIACTIQRPAPAPPRYEPAPLSRSPLAGRYDFELMRESTAKRCVAHSDAAVYWAGVPDIDQLAAEPLARKAIAAAAYDAIERLDGADSILLTRVVTYSEGGDRRCAHIVGRGIRFVTPLRATTEPAATSRASWADDDLIRP